MLFELSNSIEFRFAITTGKRFEISMSLGVIIQVPLSNKLLIADSAREISLIIVTEHMYFEISLLSECFSAFIALEWFNA